MDMNQFRPEFHIAQQSRRDKLRIQNDSNSSHHNLHGVYFNNLEQLPPSNEGLNYEPRNWRSGNIYYEMPVFCSEMPGRVDPGPYHSSFSRESFDPNTVSNDPPYFNTWKSIGSQSTTDWVANHINSNPMPTFSPNLNNSSNYQNALQELVTTSFLVPDQSRVTVARGGNSSNTQGLCLSLSSSVPSLRVQTQSRDICAPGPGPSTNINEWKKPELCIKTGRAQTLNHRNPGPLGPFTGYATILTSSKFLRPAQQLLEELCCMARPKEVEMCEVDDRSLEQLLRVSSDAVDMKAMPADSSCVSSSFAFSASTEKKAKLLYMQDEVCKRYKQYHQQMQMVVSSFETVAGLSSATPYVSLALKMVSKHFRCLKNTITDQLKSLKNSLGEELSSPSAGTSSSKGDTGASMLKFLDQNFQKQKGAAGNLGILENQHIWRPQRGLPERAVSILRAWLFDHFLHPYPTDTDKHMLATQTGLTRNQVSNWFINARVRVWKPMVEEIHMLETKGGVADQTDQSDAGKTTPEGCDHQPSDQSSSQSLNRLRMRAIQDKQAECSTTVPSEHDYEVGRSNENMWNQEKRSRIEYHMIPSSIDGSLMGFVPSHQSGIEMGGLGSVSLTLGLRQSAENAQRQPEHHLRPFGGQMIHDFVG